MQDLSYTPSLLFLVFGTSSGSLLYITRFSIKKGRFTVKTVFIYVAVIAGWFVYFQFIDWLFMKIQGLSYFGHMF